MHDDDAPKTAYELAMARLRKQDEAEGVERRELTDAQRVAITDARNLCEAKLAEREVLHQSSLRGASDPAAVATLEQEYRRDRDRLMSDRDARIERIRRG